MWTPPYWLSLTFPGRLGVSSRPRGHDWLEDELKGWRSAGVDLVVSLLTADETASLGLDAESDLCRASAIDFRTFPIADRSVPESAEQFLKLVQEISTELQSGKNVVVHCRQGIGRAGLFASAVLLESGQSLEAALQTVSVARGVAVPETEEQAEWLIFFVELSTELKPPPQ